jgi:hypothetical protein
MLGGHLHPGLPPGPARPRHPSGELHRRRARGVLHVYGADIARLGTSIDIVYPERLVLVS